jgi:hypothetical protein
MPTVLILSVGGNNSFIAVMANAGDEVVYFRTEKGKDAIAYRGHCYRLDRSGVNGLYWRCLKNNCRGRVMTDINRDNLEVRTDHDHNPDFDGATVREVRERLRKRAFEENIPIPQIYQQEVGPLANRPMIAARMPGYPSVNVTMYRERHASLPPLPQSAAAIVIPQEYTLSTTGQRFLLSQSANNEFITFATDTNLRLLCEADDIYMDGTFDTAPSLYSQLYTIHIFVEDRMVPVMYALMISKTTQLYVSMFQSVINESNHIALPCFATC